jgi:predicted TIM-barrel fold metal-dependent hydrolase
MSPRIIDTNVHLSRWPTRRLVADQTAQLVQKLRSAGVTQAWVCSFDALLHNDLTSVNQRLHDSCRRDGQDFLIPFAAINPLLPGWERDLQSCARERRMPGIRLYPGYHGYELRHPSFAETLAAAEELGLLVQIVVKLEDERTQHRNLRAATVDVNPLIEAIGSRTQLPIQLLGALRDVRSEVLMSLISAGNVFVEISHLEGVGGLEQLLLTLPAGRILFGSHFPFFYFESATLKLQESNIGGAQLQSICHENATALLRRN